MCGIVGYIGRDDCAPLLYEGLRKLEYRGYDSAGLAVRENGQLRILRTLGNLDQLDVALARETPLSGQAGIAHTRWATHGRPSELNAHPHPDCSNRLAVVHNGIIENHLELRERLTRRGHHFRSDTDTETIAHLIEEHWQGDLPEAVRKALAELQGAFAVAVISADSPVIVAGRKDSPLVVGIAPEGNFVASAIPAFLGHTRQVVYVENDEVVELSADGVRLTNLADQELDRAPTEVTWSSAEAEKGGYADFMLKEIHDQPVAVADTLRGRFGPGGAILLDELRLSREEIQDLDHVQIVACGTSYHAGLVAKYVLEEWARLPVEVEVGSEYRYRHPIVTPRTLVLAISQSGETADTLAGVRQARAQGAKVVAIVNVVGSLMTREADAVIYTHAGLEIGVAATKTFLAQLAAVYLLGLHLGRERGVLEGGVLELLISEVAGLPAKIEHLVADEGPIKALAESYHRYGNFLYLGRGVGMPIAHEGALKLKEISYIHAEGYPAGEMKHGPIALLDPEVPVLAIATHGHVREKMMSNMEEARARQAKVIAVATEGDEEVARLADDTIVVPLTEELLTPATSIVPLQLFAYHVAKLRGCNVDQPRNLAKSVTVE